MATVTYVNNDYEVLAQAMQQLVTMDYFDSVEYDSENDAVVCKDADEHAVLTLAKDSSNSALMSVALLLDGGTTKTGTMSWRTTTSGSIGGLMYCYICSGGVYLLGGTESSGYSFMIISKTNNDKIGILANIGANSTSPASARLSSCSWATDDDTALMNSSFTFATNAQKRQETLFNVPTSASANSAPSYFPDVYSEFTTQYSYVNNVSTPPVGATVDGKNYLWVGYFMIADEEE